MKRGGSPMMSTKERCHDDGSEQRAWDLAECLVLLLLLVANVMGPYYFNLVGLGSIFILP